AFLRRSLYQAMDDAPSGFGLVFERANTERGGRLPVLAAVERGRHVVLAVLKQALLRQPTEAGIDDERPLAQAPQQLIDSFFLLVLLAVEDQFFQPDRPAQLAGWA